MVIVREIECKSLLNKSAIAEYCINPYVGCQHGCRYCYAAGITFRLRRRREEWGTFLDVKINALDILSKEVKNKRIGRVYLSSLTDPYQQMEKKYELTRRIIEILMRNSFPVIIQTKSKLVTRDLDLLSKNKTNEVGVTIVSMDEKISGNFEPFSSKPEERLEAIGLAKDNGLKTYVFFGPVLPYLSDNDIGGLLLKFKESGADYIYVDRLNLRPMVWGMVSKVVLQKYPELYEKWKRIFFSKSSYYDDIKKNILKKSREIGLETVFCY
ncbi:MAG: radical SAM protein [Candidatus Brockarchaeota archaeon]|nr:radical SAM protein [Candidatus Brockarchaeota archaeon]